MSDTTTGSQELVTTSSTIAGLVKALALAQGKITGARKDSANPFYKSKYADLASVWDACRGPLSDNGLAVIQTTELDDQGVTVITTLAHESGEWISGRLRMMPKDGTPQAIGSTLTYARRYALAAIVGVAQIDDDANAGSGKTDNKDIHPPLGEVSVTAEIHGWAQDMREAVAAKSNDDIVAYAKALNAQGEEVYRAVWSLLNSKERAYIKATLHPKEAA